MGLQKRTKQTTSQQEPLLPDSLQAQTTPSQALCDALYQSTHTHGGASHLFHQEARCSPAFAGAVPCYSRGPAGLRLLTRQVARQPGSSDRRGGNGLHPSPSRRRSRRRLQRAGRPGPGSSRRPPCLAPSGGSQVESKMAGRRRRRLALPVFRLLFCPPAGAAPGPAGLLMRHSAATHRGGEQRHTGPQGPLLRSGGETAKQASDGRARARARTPPAGRQAPPRDASRVRAMVELHPHRRAVVRALMRVKPWPGPSPARGGRAPALQPNRAARRPKCAMSGSSRTKQRRDC